MKKYRLVTGFYPSKETAERICTKVYGNCKTARVEKYEDCYIVNLFESDDYDLVDNKFSECMKNKIYCGIMTNENMQ